MSLCSECLQDILDIVQNNLPKVNCGLREDSGKVVCSIRRVSKFCKSKGEAYYLKGSPRSLTEDKDPVDNQPFWFSQSPERIRGIWQAESAFCMDLDQDSIDRRTHTFQINSDSSGTLPQTYLQHLSRACLQAE